MIPSVPTASQAVLGSANLFSVDWNSQGCEGYINLPGARGWIMFISVGTGGNTTDKVVSCRNTQGVGVNETEYSLAWEDM
jgi:hypothetical protein